MRLAGHLSSKWLSKMLHLYEEVQGQPGKLQAVMPEPETSLSQEDLDSLKQVPGVFEAYEGLNKLQLQVLVIWLIPASFLLYVLFLAPRVLFNLSMIA